MNYLTRMLAYVILPEVLPGVPHDIHVERVKAVEVEEVIRGGVISAIDEQDTAWFLSKIFGVPVPCERHNIHLSKDDRVYIAQIKSCRPPEGATTLPNGKCVDFLKMTLI